MKKLSAVHIRYSLTLIAIVSISEYITMELLGYIPLMQHLSREAASIADSLLLIMMAAGPIYFFILKPVMSISKTYQHRSGKPGFYNHLRLQPR